MKQQTKAFKVASVSDNLNSFGLRGMILVAADGEAWECGASHLNVKVKGELLHVPIVGQNGRNFASLAFEIPHQLPVAPPGVVSEVWSNKENQ